MASLYLEGSIRPKQSHQEAWARLCFVPDFSENTGSLTEGIVEKIASFEPCSFHLAWLFYVHPVFFRSN